MEVEPRHPPFLGIPGYSDTQTSLECGLSSSPSPAEGGREDVDFVNLSRDPILPGLWPILPIGDSTDSLDFVSLVNCSIFQS